MKNQAITRLAAILLFSFTTINFLSAQTTLVKGTLLDVDGKPSSFALVGFSLTQFGNAQEFVQCDSKGSYSITLKKPGVYFLMYTIPSHEALRIPILNNKSKTITIDVTLSPYQYKDTYDDLGIYGSFNKFTRQPLEKMVKQENGTYTYEIKTDQKEVRYQLLGIERNGRTVNAPDAASYIPDSSGDYHSVAQVHDGKVTVVFDPAKLLKRVAESKVNFRSGKDDELCYKIREEFSANQNAAQKSISEYRKTHREMKGYVYDGGAYLRELPGRIASEKENTFKDLLKLSYLGFAQFRPAGFDSAKARGYFESIPANSMLWDLIPQGFYAYYSLFTYAEGKLLQEKFLKETHSSEIQTGILANMLSSAKFAANVNELKRLHALITSEYKDNKDLQRLLAMFPIQTRITDGADIPDYEIASLADSTIRYSKKAMLGKIYLMDFWATWCGPCVGEMDALHKAYDAYKGKGLEILSLSMDENSAIVQKFQAEKWAMPWKHAFLGTEWGRAIIKDFEVIGIPAPILVSAEGKVLAHGGDLRGEVLEKTLAKYFK